jgi:hypothetical protein
MTRDRHAASSASTEPADLVVVNVAAPTAAGLARALDQLAAACRTQRRFGAMIDARSAEGPAAGPSPGRVEQIRRLRAMRAELRDRCVGIAFVTAPTEAGGQGKRLRAARLMLGCPVEAFDSVALATGWLAGVGAGGDS